MKFHRTFLILYGFLYLRIKPLKASGSSNQISLGVFYNPAGTK
ncbi:hypothetical protein HMPREF0204_11296 [Chryseobacterium gleum ATCC 35910]|uniref:Uncharacterized protein n=1 Tax=Chryseobacterium gleum ATCC 35910 TaxID=525257 RepID=A0ABN0AUJ6_CHRGE|nr:hypothetical protein HMPREF0204_11296 [Chryseobacterium gleum ATCC 35910]